MNGSMLVIALVVVVALSFDFTNGFHDTANAMATSIATGALPPRAAVGRSALLNIVGAFISLAVATTIAKGVVDSQAITTSTVFAGLVGAIVWNLITWFFGLPTPAPHTRSSAASWGPRSWPQARVPSNSAGSSPRSSCRP